jgi:hypothetical protein
VSASISPSPFRFLAAHSLLYVDSPTSSSSPLVRDFPPPAWPGSPSFPRRQRDLVAAPIRRPEGRCTVGGEFPLTPFRLRGGFLVPPWSPRHRFLLSMPLQGSHAVVARSSGFSPPHGYPASQALSPQYYSWICHPLPPSRSGVAVTGSVFYGRFRPQGRRTSRGKTHSLSVSRPTSVHGGYSNRILGLAQPRLLTPLRTPI